MLKLGVFGGSYFYEPKSRVDIPISLFNSVPKDKYCNKVFDVNVNKYKIKAGLSKEWWDNKNLINDDYDPYGWFQWYCRFFYGRRCEDDKRQVNRWVTFKARHYTRYTNLCVLNHGGLDKVRSDDSIYPRYKQSMIQWAIKP